MFSGMSNRGRFIAKITTIAAVSSTLSFFSLRQRAFSQPGYPSSTAERAYQKALFQYYATQYQESDEAFNQVIRNFNPFQLRAMIVANDNPSQFHTQESADRVVAENGLATFSPGVDEKRIIGRRYVFDNIILPAMSEVKNSTLPVEENACLHSCYERFIEAQKTDRFRKDDIITYDTFLSFIELLIQLQVEHEQLSSIEMHSSVLECLAQTVPYVVKSATAAKEYSKTTSNITPDDSEKFLTVATHLPLPSRGRVFPVFRAPYNLDKANYPQSFVSDETGFSVESIGSEQRVYLSPKFFSGLHLRHIVFNEGVFDPSNYTQEELYLSLMRWLFSDLPGFLSHINPKGCMLLTERFTQHVIGTTRLILTAKKENWSAEQFMQQHMRAILSQSGFEETEIVTMGEDSALVVGHLMSMSKLFGSKVEAKAWYNAWLRLDEGARRPIVAMLKQRFQYPVHTYLPQAFSQKLYEDRVSFLKVYSAILAQHPLSEGPKNFNGIAKIYSDCIDAIKSGSHFELAWSDEGVLKLDITTQITNRDGNGVVHKR